jgi:hypothetical protein
MAKKPPLTLVDPSTSPDPLAPPPTLGETGTKLWQSILGEYRIDDIAGLVLLQQACAAADTAALCDDAVARDGVMIRTKSGLREHPLMKVALGARALIVRTLGRLNLDVEPPRPTGGRPPGTYNPTKP